MPEQTKVSSDLKKNIEQMEKHFHDCADMKKKKMKLGIDRDVDCYLTYIEVSVGMGYSELGRVLEEFSKSTRKEILQRLEENALCISDAVFFETIEEAVDGLLTGETILFVDGFTKVVKIPDEGYPGIGIGEADSEKEIGRASCRERV